MADNPKLTILLPVRNDGVSLRVMLRILDAAMAEPHEVVVVYDFPEDNCVEVVEEMGRTHPRIRGVENRLGPGVRNAINAGVAAAQGNYVLIFAADEVGPVVAVEDMIALLDQGCDFVSCTRYAHGGRRLGGSWIGGVLSRVANVLFHRVARCALTDATTGIKMFRRECFGRLDLRANPVGWAVAFEMAIKAQHMGFRLGEVPILSVDRLYGGKSTFKLGPWCVEYLRWFFWGVRRLRAAERPQVEVRVPMSTPSD